MTKVYLHRLNSTDQGTYGVLAMNGQWWYTLELPDKDNRPNVSRIPSGEYLVTRRYSPSFKKELYWVHAVPGRSFILLHGANFAGDIEKGWQSHLQGCITLGKKIGKFTNKFGVLQKCVMSSQQAIREFESYLNKESFKLVIRDIVV